MCVWVSICLRLCLSVSISLYKDIFVSPLIGNCLSVGQSAWLSIRQCVYVYEPIYHQMSDEHRRCQMK